MNNKQYKQKQLGARFSDIMKIFRHTWRHRYGDTQVRRLYLTFLCTIGTGRTVEYKQPDTEGNPAQDQGGEKDAEKNFGTSVSEAC